MGIAGAMICAATIFLRGTGLMNVTVVRFILGSLPNLGSMWLLYCFAMLGYHRLFRVQPKRWVRYSIIGGVLLLLLASEIFHDVLLDSSFDNWDIIASCVAAAVLILLRGIDEKLSSQHEADSTVIKE